MSTPASIFSSFRPLLLGLAASACGGVCLVTLGCGEGEPSSPTPNGTSGSASVSGASGTGGTGLGGAAGATSGGMAGGGVTSDGGVVGNGGTTGGTAGTGTAGTGTAGSAGNGGAGGSRPTTGTATRPLLTAEAAAGFTVAKYLEKAGPVATPVADNWDPTPGVDITTLTPTYRVAATGGTDTTIQSAITKAVTAGGTARVAIEVADGTYREVVCVPGAAPPITLYSRNPDASATRIVFNNYNGKPKEAQTPANPCNPALGDLTHGTSGSPTFAAYSAGFQAKNLTIENDTDETGITSNVQAVALSTQGDKQIYDNVRLLGNQDTFLVKSPNAATITRVYVTKSFIQGDTDFIFGRGTLVVDASEIRFVSARQGSKGYAIVPSTDARNPFGILINKCKFTADAATMPNTIHLGRAWDESGKDVATYAMLVASGVYPNGQAVIRESELGVHVRLADPWAPAATTSRPFSAVATTLPANRLYELGNTGPGAAP
ncbi:MAG: acyl-CoA thioesterase [Polyangiaceae bacterium]|nr:acyl-CoA thioesterase [Polyangiaceae bacterium]